MSGAVDGESLRVPAQVEDPEAIEPVYAAIKALVPQDIWDGLLARREQYERDYEGGWPIGRLPANGAKLIDYGSHRRGLCFAENDEVAEFLNPSPRTLRAPR